MFINYGLSFIQCIYYEHFSNYKMFNNTKLNILNLLIFIKTRIISVIYYTS